MVGYPVYMVLYMSLDMYRTMYSRVHHPATTTGSTRTGMPDVCSRPADSRGAQGWADRTRAPGLSLLLSYSCSGGRAVTPARCFPRPHGNQEIG